MDYKDFLETRLKDYRTRKNQDDIIDPAEPFIELKVDQDHRQYFRQLIVDKIATKQAVDAAALKIRLAARLTKALGDNPATARDYARLYAAKERIGITYGGRVTIPGIDNSSIIDFARGARLTAGELGITYSRDTINDAVEDYYTTAREGALDAIRQGIEPRAEFDWLKLSSGLFDPSSGSPEFVAAVLRKFVWQVKRKLHNLPVSFPLMPVITGAQGSGKSWFVAKLTDPISDLVTSTDFGALADDRNIDLWRSYVLILDEMAKAIKADTETIKHVITADHLERRPMRTNTTVTISQRATLIGTTNLSLAEIIIDPTGNRRFAELKWVRPDNGFLDQFDLKLAWQSVHHTDQDPMAAHMDALANLQSESRNHGPVENWLLTLSDEDWRNLHEASDDGFVTTQSLFNAYLVHRSLVNGGSENPAERRTLNTFSQELGRVTGNADYGFARHRTNKANGWRITRPCPPVAIPPVFSLVGGNAR